MFNHLMREDMSKLNFKNTDNSKVDLNNLMKKVKEEEKKNKRTNLAVSAAAVSAVAVFGIILTL